MYCLNEVFKLKNKIKNLILFYIFIVKLRQKRINKNKINYLKVKKKKKIIKNESQRTLVKFIRSWIIFPLENTFERIIKRQRKK